MEKVGTSNTAIERGEWENADQILPSIPQKFITQVAHMLEGHGFLDQAMAVTRDATSFLYS